MTHFKNHFLFLDSFMREKMVDCAQFEKSLERYGAKRGLVKYLEFLKTRFYFCKYGLQWSYWILPFFFLFHRFSKDLRHTMSRVQ